MIIQIFKIHTKELYILKNKSALKDFMYVEVGYYAGKYDTIDKMLSYLPVSEYYILE